MAAALVNDPEVIFLDEPTTGLDPQMRHSLWELMQRLNREEGKTVVLTTHYMEEAELLADRVAIIDHGRISAIDTPRNLIAGLDGRGHIEFATPRPVESAELSRLSGVTGAAVRSNGEVGSPQLTTYRLDVDEPRAAVTALLSWSEGHGIELRGLEVAPGTLEDVFLRLTGRELRE